MLAGICALLLVPACSGGDKEQMLRQLEELERMNRADSVMRNDSLAEQLAEYFDSHGTPNERMRAHYILGRTYADMGEAPAAVNAYLDAADAADTTAADCDFRTLSRVYGQMSSVLYKQNLMEDYIKACDEAISCAWRAKDTLQAVNNIAYRIEAYERLRLNDSVISMFIDFYNLFTQLYGEDRVAPYCIIPVRALLENGDTLRAGHYLSLIEAKSGYFNAKGDIEAGRENYYYYKGRYLMAIHQYDSAEYLFRKELYMGKDAINQSMALRGLSLLYAEMGIPDSASKYAIYSYEMNDTAYSRMATSEVARMVSLYNYSRHQAMAAKKEKEVESRKWENLYLCVLLGVVFLVLLAGVLMWRKEKRKTMEQYREKVAELSQIRFEYKKLQSEQNDLQSQLSRLEDSIEINKKEVDSFRSDKEQLKILLDKYEKSFGQQASEVMAMKQHEEHLESIIRGREEELQKNKSEIAAVLEEKNKLASEMAYKNEAIMTLETELRQYKQAYQQMMDSTEPSLRVHPVYLWLHSRDVKKGVLSEKEWVKIENLIKETLPNFYNYIISERYKITRREYKICLLFRLHVRTKEVSGLLGIAQTQISRSSRDAFLKLFTISGTGKDLMKHLESIV